jgi:hypothetical protein
MTTTVTHTITSGDFLSPLYAQLKKKNASGVLTAVDLDGLTVKFKLVSSSGTEAIAETDTGVTVSESVSGKVQYDFSASLDAGIYYGWFIVYDGAERDTYPATGRKLRIVIVESE